MARSDRLFDLLTVLRDGKLHTAQALAQRMGVSVRTLYRDMESLAASGVPVAGTRGTGYRLTHTIAAEVADPQMRAAANTLADKLDAVLPQSAVPQADAWKFAASAFADAARGLSQIPTLRAAIKARQKLRITYTGRDGAVTSRVIRPLHLEYWSRIWTLTAWCELRSAHRVFRLDLVNSAEALPELFNDEPGKTLADYTP